jgi:alkanesulfonate monooxygenase SsuD/methylene tetrahydromethanopterin reductase-like flavin-dependent oxidoreductase (luciferase family)
VTALAADTAELAEHLSLPGQLRRFGLKMGRRFPLPSPEEAARHPDLGAATSMPSNRIVGDPTQVHQGLEELAVKLGADELMLATTTFGLTERIDNLRIIADRWFAEA